MFDDTFEHEISDRELLERHVGPHVGNFPTLLRGVLPVKTLDSYLAKIKPMLSAYKNERLRVKNPGTVLD